MVYRMEIYVDGGCRRNGYSDAMGAAAAIRQSRSGSKYWHRTRRLSKKPTNQRAEITAIILGIQMALDAYDDLDSYPRLDVTIYSDSRYAVGCMTDWVYKWANNGWVNSRGVKVSNKNLIKKASALDDKLSELGNVTYSWIPRSENELADKHCNEELDAMEQGGYYDSDSDDYGYDSDFDDD
ncbi:hypothetical protein FQN55_005512 [Onygenales sp. PD_40]|nr:hypothetical protein FQN55_005512 [Onygenales sp. PD_40]KAK2780822.1 hypothetical protein FQN53_000947 [Emmonsiellopsis sp. PD_33]KAK2789032.1 hypothetical protein FQN52_006399 [Onygenales sp. PD_12]KAK2801216.1 hypothetical protein FQN51_005531 [Onygenales sp. PD_10]